MSVSSPLIPHSIHPFILPSAFTFLPSPPPHHPPFIFHTQSILLSDRQQLLLILILLSVYTVSSTWWLMRFQCITVTQLLTARSLCVRLCLLPAVTAVGADASGSLVFFYQWIQSLFTRRNFGILFVRNVRCFTSVER